MKSQHELEVSFFDITRLWEAINALETLKSDHAGAEITYLSLDGEELSVTLEWRSE